MEEISRNGGLIFLGCGTFSSSPTSDGCRHMDHCLSFRGRRDDKNDFWTVSISTFSLELWGLEYFERSL